MEEQFLALENKWMNAWKNKDIQTCSEIIADDFTLTSSLSTGELMTKAQWLASVEHYYCISFNFDNIKVRTYGPTAIVQSWYHQEANANGTEWSGNFLMTDIWVHADNNWKVVARHASWLQNNK
jgi:ketosteroid isomerase-like protein